MEEATLAVVDEVFFSGEKDERILVREAVAERINNISLNSREFKF